MLDLLLTLALATPRDVWLDRHPRAQAEWIDEQDELARGWVTADGLQESVEAWLAARRAERPDRRIVWARRDGVTLWHQVERIGDRDDPRKPEWRQRLYVQDAGQEAPGRPLAVGDPEQAICQASLGARGRFAYVGRLEPLGADDKLSKRRDCTTYRVDLATGEAQSWETGPHAYVLEGPHLHTWSQDGRRRATVVHRDEEGTEVDRFRWRARGLRWSEARGFTAFRGRKVWIGDTPRTLTKLMKRPRGLRILQVEEEQLVAMSRSRASGGEVVRVEVDDPSPEAWRSLVAERPGSDLREAAMLGDRVLTTWTRDGLTHLEVQPYEGGPSTPIDLGGPWSYVSLLPGRGAGEMLLTAASPRGNAQWLATTDDGALQLTPLQDDLRDDLAVRSVLLPTMDGDVAVTLVHAPDAVPDGAGPLLLHTYGGFGHSQQVGMRQSDELFVAAGGAVGFVHARGGRERGEDWHEGAILEHLDRTSVDVDAAAEGLIELGWAAPGRVALWGASNGGFTVTATLSRAPQRYGAVVAVAGVYDLIRGPRFGGHWWPDEYGRPRGDHLAVLEALSPRQNPPDWLPPMWVTTGVHDPVVPPRHSYGLASAWGEVAGGPLLLRVVDHGTHGGRKRDRDDLRRSPFRASEAETAAFLLRALRMEVPGPGIERNAGGPFP